MLTLLIGLLLLIILVGVVLLLAYSQKAARLGSLAGERIYQDSPHRAAELLRASSLPLCGKPDYLIQTVDGIVQLKATDAPLPFRRRYLCRDCRQELRLNTGSWV